MNRSTARRLLHRWLALPLALAAVALSGLAVSQEAAPPAAPAPPASVDTDGDGALSPAEHTAAAQAAFRRMDRDGDGRVTVAEMQAMQDAGGPVPANAPSAADRMKAVDANGDGVLTAQEHAAATQAAYTRLDANADGRLTLDEVRAGAAAAQKARAGQAPPPPR